jgi:H+-transporting ATPase
MQFQGLSGEEAKHRQEQEGPNRIPEERESSFALFLKKFSAPVPFLLEVIIFLEIIFENFLEASIIFSLLLFNAALSFFQEERARKAIELLKSRLRVFARVLRDDTWTKIPAEDLVRDDIIHLRVGDIVPADVTLLEGLLKIDQSQLTGESFPIEAKEGTHIFAGSLIKFGEGTAKVTAIGKKTKFSKVAEIMQKAKAPTHLESIIFRITKSLVIFDLILIFALLLWAYFTSIPIHEILPFTLLLLVAAIPLALPATFALATAQGARELATSKVLVSRLSAIEEAAAMTLLCVDKTGTLTQNKVEVAGLHTFLSYTEEDLLHLAALASDEASQDPLDLAILKAVKERNITIPPDERIQFFPFDQTKKYSSATIVRLRKKLQVFKGSLGELLKMVAKWYDTETDIASMINTSSRALGVVFGTESSYELVGVITFQDPPREDSLSAIDSIRKLGVKLMMMTGDALATAKSIGVKVGIGDKILSREEALRDPQKLIEYDGIAEVFPADKFRIVSLLQKQGYVCGMTGDGVNNAPALKQAEVPIATSNASDVAKASAGMVLSNPGLGDIVEAIKTSRRIYQRMLTYTLNKIIKTLEIGVLLTVGLMLTKTFIISPLLLVFLLFFNDFATMSIATDKVSFSPVPDKWNISRLMQTGGMLSGAILGLSFILLLAGIKLFSFSVPELQTWVFLILVFCGQATIYLIRERGHFWHSLPSTWLMASSCCAIFIASCMALFGLFMAPLSLAAVVGLLLLIGSYFVFLDFMKGKLISIRELSRGI